MALFTDGYIATVQDLIAYESNLVEVADAEAIDLEGKLRLAQSELAAELGAAALGPGNVYWAGQPRSGFGRFELEKVVVTPPLKLWHTFQTLATVYRDAYNRKLNDKYLPKWDEYKGLAGWASNLLYQTGVGLVVEPVPRAQKPALDWVPGTLPAMTVYVQAAWVKDATEGAPSEEAALDIPADSALRVTPPAAPAGVTGWHVYAGTASGEEKRQNSDPLEPGAAWTMPTIGLVEGPAPGAGQEPDLFKTAPRFLQRG